ncbi:MAG TPA: SGNH/GDSL hydrolase family protein [Candidatus Polarisedimenticolia bacterium]|nr:SGNH/GDSL hydrolase family protein [Candidatus Polarisedimenticolia bacterium]
MSGRTTEILPRLLLILGGTIAGLLLAEVVVRVALPPPPTVVIARTDAVTRRAAETRAPKSLRVVTQGDLGPYGFVLETPAGLRMRASSEARIQNYPGATADIIVRTNSLGYRNPEIGPKTKPRVLFLGDSVTLSQYLPEEASFVRRVQALSEQDGGPPFETINAAVAGIGLANEIAILEETGLSTAPDIVVIGFFLNDAEASRGVRLMQPPALLRWSWLARQAGAMIPALLEPESFSGESWETGAWRAELRRLYPPGPGDPAVDRPAFNAEVLASYFDWGSAWTDSAWGRIEPLLMQFKRLSAEHRFRPMLLAFPATAQVQARFDASEPQRRLGAIARSLDLPLLDLLPRLRETVPKAPRPILADHCHYTDYGNEVLSPWVLKFLRTDPGLRPVARPS